MPFKGLLEKQPPKGAVTEMSKPKPTTVYVHSEPHETLNLSIEAALDGHGSLGGFFAFLEREFATFQSFDIPEEPEPNSWLEFTQAMKNVAGRWLDPKTYAQYRDLYRVATATLPFSKLPKSAAHLFALFMHAQANTIELYAQKFESNLETRKRNLPAKIERIKKIQKENEKGEPIETIREVINEIYNPKIKKWNDLVILKSIISYNSSSVGSSIVQELSNEISATFYADRLEFDLEISKSNVDKRPFSLYLEPELHKSFISAMGSRIFRALEWALSQALPRQKWSPVDSEILSRFLEHGTDLLEFEEASWKPTSVGLDILRKWPDSDDDQEAMLRDQLKDNLWETIYTNSNNNESLPPEFLKEFQKQGWPLDNDEEIAIDAISQSPTMRLAEKVGALNIETPNLEQIEQNLPGCVMRVYGLPTLMPERALLAAAIAHAVPMPAEREPEHPLEFHATELFRLYALSVLPSEERYPRRVDRDVFAELADPRTLKTRSSLEFASRGKAQRTKLGTWQIVRSRRVELGLSEISNLEAYKIANVLSSLRPETRGWSGSDLKVLLEQISGDVVAGRVKGIKAQPLKLMLGPQIVSSALGLVRQFSKLEADDLAVTLALLLADDALKAGGRLIAAMLEAKPSWRTPLESALGKSLPIEPKQLNALLRGN